MGVILHRTNDALNINPPSGDTALSVNGSDWLWTVAAVYAFSFVIVLGLSYFARAGEKVFHYLYTIGLGVGFVAYFTMASDLGFAVVKASTEKHRDATRQIFYAKYINWVVAFPIEILSLGLLSGISWATIVYQIALSWIWVITYLAAAVTPTSYKWGYYCIGTVVWLVLASSTLGTDNYPAARRNGVARDHSILSGWLNLIWLLYPIAHGLSDGGNRIVATSGMIFFGVLDIVAIPVLGFATLFLSRHWDYNKLNIAFTQYGRVPVANGQYPEKESVPASAPTGGVTDPAVTA